VLSRFPGALSTPAYAEDLGTQMSIATWPNYHDPATFENFKAATGVAVEVNVFGSNEEMLAKLQAGASGWSLFVPTNYTISTHHKLGLIDELDLSKIPNFSQATENPRFTKEGMIDGKTYAVPKNWGTTGFSVNTSKIKTKLSSWKHFFEIVQTEADGRAMVHDYQLTTIGSALVSLGYGFNSIKADELAKAEELLIKVKPHLFAINSDYQPAMRATDAWLTMCWTNDGAQLNRDVPEIAYVLGTDGGEIWTDYYAIPKDAPNKAAGYALLNYLMDPAYAVKEHVANGAPTTDSRVIALLPKEITANKIVYPDEAQLTPLEFGAAVTLTDPGRAELMARFKSA
jgi:spermidine/putrescine transport system substrate-binding protein